MPLEESTREIVEVAANIPKDLDGWQHYWFDHKAVKKWRASEKKMVEF